MNVSCDVIRDLMPLYIEGLLTDDSVRLIEKHLESCEKCQHVLDEMTHSQSIHVENTIEPLIKIKKVLRKRKAFIAMMTFMITLLLSTVFFSFLTSPKYIPYSEDLLQISDLSDGSVIVNFNETVTGYDVNAYSTESNTGTAYHMTTWTTTLNEIMNSRGIENIILDGSRDSVSSIYYYQTDGSEDRLIYGNSEFSNGGVYTLPRLNLSYYIRGAIIIGTISLIVTLVFSRKKKKTQFSVSIMLLAFSYILAHLIINGLTSASFQSTRDLLAIILITIPIYVINLLGLHLYLSRKESKTTN